MSSAEPIILKRRALPFIVSGALLIPLLVVALAMDHTLATIAIVVGVAALFTWLAIASGRRMLTLDADGITDTGMVSPTSIPWARSITTRSCRWASSTRAPRRAAACSAC